MTKKLSGKKTYLLGGIMVIVSILFALNIIPKEAFLEIIGILAGLIALTLRSAIKKIEKNII